MRSKNAPLYLSRLDHLRFLAAALVIVYHYCARTVGEIGTTNPLVSLIDEGHTGVALFMVMSGFIFAVIAYGREVDYIGFIKNRFIRIYPLYLFAVLLSVYIGRPNYTFPDILGSLLPFVNLKDPPTVNSFDQLWTIAVEFQFYLIFPFLWAFFRGGGFRYPLALIVLLLICRAFSFGIYTTVQDLSYWTIFGRLDQFLIGMMCGVVFRSRPAIFAHPVWLLLFCVLLLGGIHWFNNVGGFYGAGYPSLRSFWIYFPTVEGLVWAGVVLSYVNCRVHLPSLADKGLAWLGQISFSLYVMHNLVIFFFVKAVGDIVLRPGHHVFNAVFGGVLVILPITIVLAAFTYYLIESPFLRYRVKYLK